MDFKVPFVTFLVKKKKKWWLFIISVCFPYNNYNWIFDSSVFSFWFLIQQSYDRGSSFMSHILKTFIHSIGLAISRYTPYSTQGSGQVEKYNGIIWKTIQLCLRSNDLPINKWLSTELYSIRLLLCTATNATLHECLFNHPRRSSNDLYVSTQLNLENY